MDDILLPTEIDLYIDTMQGHKMEDIGSKGWMEWHQRLQKLNQQASIEATAMREEAVKEALIVRNKVPILVFEAICISVWKTKILPIILKVYPDPPNTFTVYTVLYHEACCVSLLENVLYHVNTCESLEDTAIDLLDYCYEVTTKLSTYIYIEPSLEENSVAEIQRQKADLEFDIGVRAISILRYMSEFLERMPVSLTSRMFSTHDIPLLFVELITTTPWIRKDKRNTLKYIDGRWQIVTGENLFKLTRTEAQIWLGLRQLLLDPRCPSYYDITEFRKTQLLKLQKYMNELLLDQLAPLIDLKQWLCQLSVANPPAISSRPFILEVVPEIKEKILSHNHNKWRDLARKQAKILFSSNKDDIMELAQSLSEAYNTDLLEKLDVSNKTQCGGGCNRDAIKKCSRCKGEWYCSRDCQVRHWPVHREICDQLVGKN